MIATDETQDTYRAPLEISVIIPTFNRPAVLAATLEYLTSQTLPASAFEVIVVHDGAGEVEGSSDRDPQARPFEVATLRIPRAGPAAARNAGAHRASADVLVFLDDDIALAPRALEVLSFAVRSAGSAIVLGALIDRPAPDGDIDLTLSSLGGPAPADSSSSGQEHSVVEVHFTACLTGCLGITRDHFDSLGGFQDPTGGWPSWDDVDFGYRAHLAGLRVVRAPGARAIHRDSAQGTFEAARDRWWRAAHSAVALFDRHPELQYQLLMFRDKTPILWGTDPAPLIARKIARRALSSRPAAMALSALRRSLRLVGASEKVIRILENWLIRGAMVHGFRAGLRGSAEGRDRA